jgi:prepilin-type N-terminal cleavage/methylation domain-containing protein
MSKAFTLLELVVVILIVGVLATLGFTQYGRMTERARGAEAKQILGDMRKLATAYWLANGQMTGISDRDLNIGTSMDQIPSACASTHYFSYSWSICASATVCLTATRCTTGGKVPQGPSALTLMLTSNQQTGVATWSGDY